MGRNALAHLSTANLIHNLQIIKTRSRSKVIAMVKANAYGHGLRSVSLRLEPYVDMLGVASIGEALALRKVGVKIPIMLAEGVFVPSELEVAAREGFHVVFHDATQLEWLEAAALSKQLSVWLKVNTGMRRLGFEHGSALKYYRLLNSMPNVLKPVRIISHLACADEPAHALNSQQLNAFTELVKQVEPEAEFSLCNSAAIFQFPKHHYHFVRPGIALYGVSPIQGVSAAELGLKPVMTLQAKLIATNLTPKGSTIGYGAQYTCPRDMPVGVIAFGYGDGYPITAITGTPTLIHGNICPIIGRVSMDMITVDLSASPNAKVGDVVTLWGQDLPVEEVSKFTQEISYSILTGIQHRVEFRWIDDN